MYHEKQIQQLLPVCNYKSTNNLTTSVERDQGQGPLQTLLALTVLRSGCELLQQFFSDIILNTLTLYSFLLLEECHQRSLSVGCSTCPSLL